MSQLLIVPETVQLMPKEAQALLNHAEELSAAGFEAEDFADGCLLVRQIPSCLDLGELPAVLQEMAQELIRGKDKPTYYKRERMLYTLACRSAVKAGHKSSCRELEDLARQVMTRSDIRYCPHGRPVTVSISRSSLERQFGR